ncbi:MAG: prephenate dehydratase [Candidatus Hadarchaeales archaeon]
MGERMAPAWREVALLGPEGTHTERALEALEDLLPRRARRRYLSPVAEVFEYVSTHPEALGVVPVEDSVEGEVPFVLDLLRRYHGLRVVREIRMPVVHHLLARQEDLRRVKVVASHHQALSHCRRYLRENLPHAELREMPSTAAAAELAASDPSVAAVAGERAARIYGLKVVRRNIHDQGLSFTRFFVLSQRPLPGIKPVKTSVLLELAEDRPGILQEILGEFSSRGINLTRIESRPDRGVLGEYVFFVDFQGRAGERRVEEALKAIEGKRVHVRLLGSYDMREVEGERVSRPPLLERGEGELAESRLAEEKAFIRGEERRVMAGNQIRQGELVRVKTHSGERLALVVSSDRYNRLGKEVVVVPVVEGKGGGELDHELSGKDLKFAGLKGPRTVRMGVLLTVEKGKVEREGKLPSTTVREILSGLQARVLSSDL